VPNASETILKRYVITIFGLFLWLSFGGASSTRAAQHFPLQTETDKRININTASAEELMQLPGIGPGYAARIIAHRQKHGAFKRPQDLIIVRGFSAKRYRQIAHLIRT